MVDVIGEARGSCFTSTATVCGVCVKQYSRYRCPRCAMHYCSLACYRSHGEACTEGFYAEHTQAALKSELAPVEQRLDMMKTLQRLEAADGRAGGGDGDCGDGGDVGSGSDRGSDEGGDETAEEERTQRLAQMLEQATLDESQLSADERAEFRRLLADGSLSARLQASPAWWRAIPQDAVCAGASGWRYASDAAAAAVAQAGAPPLPDQLPSLRSLTSRTPPASLLFNTLDVLCAYAYTERLFCMATPDDPYEAAHALLTLSAVLRGEQPAAHASAEESLLSFARDTESAAVATSAAFGAACLEDVMVLVTDGGLAALAFAGVTALLTAATSERRRRPLASGTPRDVGPQRDSEARGEQRGSEAGLRNSLRSAMRKAHFLEVWWATRGHAERQAGLAGLQFALRRELERREEIRVDSAKGNGSAAPRQAPVGPGGLVSPVAAQ